MTVANFIENYREAFGQGIELPIAFWYSDDPGHRIEKVHGCFFKCFPLVRQGVAVSLDAENIGCGGGKLYTGFAPMPEHVPGFVSTKERYMRTPEMVREFIGELDIQQQAEGRYLHFSRIDRLDSFEGVEGIVFLATPDVLSGLASWIYFDNPAMDAVSAPFGSGCSTMVTQVARENRIGGRRTFLGLFDPSARPFFERDLLSLGVPMSRFTEMLGTMRESCLFGTHAWGKVRARIEEQQ